MQVLPPVSEVAGHMKSIQTTIAIGPRYMAPPQPTRGPDGVLPIAGITGGGGGAGCFLVPFKEEEICR